MTDKRDELIKKLVRALRNRNYSMSQSAFEEAEQALAEAKQLGYGE